MTAKFHLSKRGVVAPCLAKEGNCPLGGQHYDTAHDAKQAAVTHQIRQLLTQPATSPPELPSDAKNLFLDLLDINDDEEALEDLDHNLETRELALAFVEDISAPPQRPEAVVLLLQDLVDVDYDDDEFSVSAETRQEALNWLARMTTYLTK